jgi:hypothetical protein
MPQPLQGELREQLINRLTESSNQLFRVRNCVICDVPIGYVRVNAELYFQRGCGCTTKPKEETREKTSIHAARSWVYSLTIPQLEEALGSTEPVRGNKPKPPAKAAGNKKAKAKKAAAGQNSPPVTATPYEESKDN